MKYTLIWVLLLLDDPLTDENERVLTSGSAAFETEGGCIDAAKSLESIENIWRNERPILILRCLPSRPDPDSDTFGACFDRAKNRDDFRDCFSSDASDEK